VRFTTDPNASINWTDFIGTGRVLVLSHDTADATLDWQQRISLAGNLRVIQVDDGSAAIDAKMSGIIAGGSSGTSNIFSKTGAGTLAFTAQNTYSGETIINSGTLMIGDGGAVGGISQNTPIITVEPGAILAVNRNNTLTQGTNPFKVAITGDGGFSQVGSGNTVLMLANTYIGPTTLDAGTLTLGAAGVLPDASEVSIGNAILAAGSFSETAGRLVITGAATINLSTGAALSFANSSAISWTGGSLTITGTFVSGSSLRFGTTSSGLTPAQLALISATGFTSFGLDANGYLTATSTGGFSSWIAGSFATGTVPGGKQGPNDDPDNDGISNLVEYAIAGQDPTVSNTSIGTFSANILSFTKRPGTSGLTYAIQDSTDLGIADAWTEVTGVPPVYVNDGTTISHTLAPGTPERNFLRLQVLSN
jgi:autotransporter-associated beta strand protein